MVGGGCTASSALLCSSPSRSTNTDTPCVTTAPCSGQYTVPTSNLKHGRFTSPVQVRCLASNSCCIATLHSCNSNHRLGMQVNLHREQRSPHDNAPSTANHTCTSANTSLIIESSPLPPTPRISTFRDVSRSHGARRSCHALSIPGRRFPGRTPTQSHGDHRRRSWRDASARTARCKSGRVPTTSSAAWRPPPRRRAPRAR